MRAVLAVLAVLATSSLAYAGPPGETPAVPIAAADDPFGEAVQQTLAERGLVLGTAATVPAGDIEVSGRMVVGFGGVLDGAVGLGRSTELWLEQASNAATTPEDGLKQLIARESSSQALGLKQVIARGARWQIAVEASLRRVASETPVAANGIMMTTRSPDPSYRPDASVDPALGAMATACFDKRCRVLATVGVRVIADPSASNSAMWLGSASVLAGGAHVRGIVEMIAAPNHSDGTIDSMLFLGARLGNRMLALEAGAAIGTDDQDAGVMPMLGLAARR